VEGRRTGRTRVILIKCKVGRGQEGNGAQPSSSACQHVLPDLTYGHHSLR
jgi:hypothetical protein